MSSKLPTKATFSLEEFSRHGGQTGHHNDGWGLAFYEGTYAQVYREAEPAAYSKWMRFLQYHQHQSYYVISHIRKATQGKRALQNTQPFSREMAGQRHVFCHNGNLHAIHDELTLQRFTPIGETDSEYAFCYLMGKISQLWQKKEKPNLSERVKMIKTAFDKLSLLGPANFLYCDGDYLYAYANKRTQANGSIKPPGMYYLNRTCDYNYEALPLSGINLQSGKTTTKQSLVLFASVPLSSENWQPFKSNQLIITQAGDVMEDYSAMNMA